MGIIFGNKQEKQMISAEQRQQAHETKNTLLSNTTHPGSVSDMVPLNQQVEKQELIRWQQELGDEQDILEHDLKNHVYTDNGWMVDPNLPALLNDKGIFMIKRELRPHLSRNLFMSNLKEDRICMMQQNTLKTIALTLVANHGTYDFDVRNINHIMRVTKNYIIPGAYRAFNEGERKHLRTMHKSVEAHTSSEDQRPKKKLFGLIG